MVLEHDPKISDPPTHWPEKNHWLLGLHEGIHRLDCVHSWELDNQDDRSFEHSPDLIHPLDSPAAPIGIKLDGSNYALWSQVVEMYISSKDKLGYINGDSPQPPETYPSFRRWRTKNVVVKGWLINSMDPTLVGNFIRFPTTK